MTRFVESGGGWALALLMLLENLFPPVPSEAVLPFAGFLVGRGDLSAVTAMAAATAGSTVGALVLYALGRSGGRAMLLRHRRIFRLSADDLDRADDWFDRHGWKVVLLARMVPLARSVVSVPAGTSQMPLGRFLLLTAAGSAVWNGILLSLGAGFGDRYEQIARLVGRASTTVVIVLGIVTLGAAAWWYRSRPPDVRSG